jgi:prevent-host-death family protein
MMTTTLSSREFNQDVTKAKKAAKNGPVFITERGKPVHVLLSFSEYQKLTWQRHNIADALALPGVEDIDFDPPSVQYDCRDAQRCRL